MENEVLLKLNTRTHAHTHIGKLEINNLYEYQKSKTFVTHLGYMVGNFIIVYR